jgi:hypothetical protein
MTPGIDDNEHEPDIGPDRPSRRVDPHEPKCHCEQPHLTPMWWCSVHGEVVVSMD